jgi:hypothetical protein
MARQGTGTLRHRVKLGALPEACAWTIEEIQDGDFLP